MSRTTDEINNQRWMGFNDTLRVLKAVWFTWYHASQHNVAEMNLVNTILMGVAIGHCEEEAFAAFLHEVGDHNHPYELASLECTICARDEEEAEQRQYGAPIIHPVEVDVEAFMQATEEEPNVQ